MNTNSQSSLESTDRPDEKLYHHFDTLLNMYDDMIEEAKSMTGYLLSNEYIYLKPVFQQFFDLFESSIHIKDKNKIEDYSEDEEYLSE